MFSKRFEKEAFKETVKDNVRALYRKTIDEATPQQLFQAVSYAVKDVIFDDWFATQKAYDEADAKTTHAAGRTLGKLEKSASTGPRSDRQIRRRSGALADTDPGWWEKERRRRESNPRIEVLQTSALPLGYPARNNRRETHMLCGSAQADFSTPELS